MFLLNVVEVPGLAPAQLHHQQQQQNYSGASGPVYLSAHLHRVRRSAWLRLSAALDLSAPSTQR